MQYKVEVILLYSSNAVFWRSIKSLTKLFISIYKQKVIFLGGEIQPTAIIQTKKVRKHMHEIVQALKLKRAFKGSQKLQRSQVFCLFRSFDVIKFN